MRIALFAGSFDPPHLGHMDVIERAGAVCDKLYVGIGVNTGKKNAGFSQEERVDLVKAMTKDLPYVEVRSFNGLVVNFAKEIEASFLVRGLRAYSDWDYEFGMALANRKMGNIETVFLMAGAGFGHISSSLIREVGSCGQRLQDFVPGAIEERICDRLTRN